MDTSQQLSKFDEGLREKYGPVIMGVDEVGRGCWFGPLVAGAVVLPADVKLVGLNDSKQLTEEQREDLYEQIKEKAVCWSVAFIEAEEIDKRGLTWANVTAMVRAAKQAEGLNSTIVNLYVIDQSPCKKLNPHVMMSKADSTSLCVAAASVMAKVTRDRHIKEIAKQYPQYGLEDNKGYINPAHIEAVNKYGLVKGLHRFSYKVTGFNKPVQASMMDFLEEEN